MRSIFIAIALTASVAGTPLMALSEAAKADTTAAEDPDQQIKCRKVEKTG